MTGGNTDSVRTPHFVIAASLTLAIARPLFEAAMRPGPATDAVRAHYRAWLRLRSAADLFLSRESTRLAGAQRRDVDAALCAAHDMAHDAPAAGIPTAACSCETSKAIEELRQLMEADAAKAA